MTNFKKGPITWGEASSINPEFAEVLASEHGNHQLYINEHGMLRWEAYPEREAEIMERFGAHDINSLFAKGADKNDPLIRELYKCMGYSLSGFWEVFYWELNNEDAHKFRGRNFDETKKCVKIFAMVETDVDMDSHEFVDEVEAYLKEKYTVKKLDWEE
ncbi:hypothetical protein MNBD_GAMMA08-1543 [hydrothermal vent metagenome]|uniref:Uncharacterized protein n=1 Tax=hydrothermal vent metagenome TaxID=652676 RepID=A0A3B0X7K8_9ZZZZ